MTRLPEAREIGHELDADHAAEPGGLMQIGTCRTCGLLIARSRRGTWSHRPSVGEIDAAQSWLLRHAGVAVVATRPVADAADLT
jgi:hypothetical protein